MSEHGVLRVEGERRGVRFERVSPVAPAEVWSALVVPERLERWLAPAQLDAKAGGEVRIEFGADQVVTGVVLACEPQRVLEYEWRFPGEEESVVRFELSPHEDGTLLVLDHRLLALEQAVGYAAGWHAHLDRLGASLRGETISWDERFAEVLPQYR